MRSAVIRLLPALGIILVCSCRERPPELQQPDVKLWYPEALSHLGELRRLLFEGKSIEAQEIVRKYFLGTPPRIRTAGDILLLRRLLVIQHVLRPGEV